MSISLIVVIFPLLVAFAAASDLFTMRIPNRVAVGLALGFLAAALTSGLPLAAVAWHFVGALAMLLTGFVLFARGWIGGGDAKLAAAVALWLGFGLLLEYVLMAAVAGGVLTMAILLLRELPLPGFALGWRWLERLHDRTSGVPYGIALAAAALLVYPKSPLWLAASGA